MGREACCRHDIAYPVSWRRVTHLQRSWRWANASRFESSRPAILITAILRNRVYVRFRRLFRFSHRTCDPSSKWPVRGPARRGQTAGEPGRANLRRGGWAEAGGTSVGRAAADGRPAVGRWRSAREAPRPFVLPVCDSVSAIFSFIRWNITKLWPPWKIKG